jgi:hypothetical protein
MGTKNIYIKPQADGLIRPKSGMVG